MPRFADAMEIIYVEGHSNDGTFEEYVNAFRMRMPGSGISSLRDKKENRGGNHKEFDMARGKMYL